VRAQLIFACLRCRPEAIVADLPVAPLGLTDRQWAFVARDQRALTRNLRGRKAGHVERKIGIGLRPFIDAARRFEAETIMLARSESHQGVFTVAQNDRRNGLRRWCRKQHKT